MLPVLGGELFFQLCVFSYRAVETHFVHKAVVFWWAVVVCFWVLQCLLDARMLVERVQAAKPVTIGKQLVALNNWHFLNFPRNIFTISTDTPRVETYCHFLP